MKTAFITAMVLSVFFCHSVFAEDEDNTPKPIKLGLDVAKAMAEQKSVGEGLKSVMQDKWSDWLWDSIGGYERIIFQNDEAEIVKAKDKIKKFVERMQAIETAALAIIEGRYDDALITAVDQITDVLDHPLVSVTWQMAKLTYQSHKEVAASQAALEIETLYGMMSNDRRLMGVINPNADSPALIPETAASADYFFDKYVMTNDSARQMLRSYVEKVLGDEWPEQSWSEYAASWMAVGSGEDTARSAEIEALATTWKNKGRTWISQLIKDVNKQARVAWGQTRVRQMMAEFQLFANRVGRFYHEDLEQAFHEFLSIREYIKKLPEMRLMVKESAAALNEFQKRFNGLTAANMPEAQALFDMANTWSLDLLQASGRAAILREEALAKQLSGARNGWLAVLGTIKDFIGRNASQAASAAEQVVDSQPAGGNTPPPSPEVISYAQKYYSAFKQYLKPFDWGRVLERMGGGVPSADPKAFVKKCVELVDMGAVGQANDLRRMWSNAVLVEIRFYQEQAEEKIFKAPKPIGGGASDAARDGLNVAYGKADIVRNNIIAAVNAEYQSAMATLEEVISAYGGLAGARARQYNLYNDAMAAAERDLPVTAARDPKRLGQLLPLADPCHVISSINVALQALKDNVHTAVAQLGPNDGDTLPSLPNIIQMKAGEILAGVYAPSAVSAYAVDAERMKKIWLRAVEQWQKIPDLSPNDIKEIQAFIDGSFDPRGRMAAIDSVASSTPAICEAMMASVRELMQLSATDGENRERDAYWLQQKSREVQAFINAQVKKGHFEPAANGYQIAAPKERIEGMALKNEPFPHAMTASELSAYASNIAGDWPNYKGYEFIKQYAPLYDKAMQAMLSMSHVTPAREANFVSPLSGHILYKSDLEGALKILSSLQEPFSDYEQKMAQVADLVPGLLRAMSDRDRAALEQRAKEYGMATAEEYVKKTTGRGLPAPDYSVNDNVRSALNDARLQHDLGRLYVEVARLALARNEALMALKNKELQDQAAAEAAARAQADKKKAQEEQEQVQEEQARRQGYSVGDVKLNAFTPMSLKGDVLFTKEDLKNGQIEITGTFNHMTGVAGVQISLDGGGTWKPLAKAQKIKYVFAPLPDAGYLLRLRVITDREEKYELNPFPELSSLTYKDVSYQQLVVEAIQRLADAYESANLSVFSDGISEQFLGGKSALVSGAQFDFEIFQGTKILVRINRIEKQKDKFIAEVKWEKSQTARSSGELQKAAGKTTLIFTLGDAQMLVHNLRGDLLFASLSPEVAQASGLSSKMVEKIREANEKRDPGLLESGDGSELEPAQELTPQTAGLPVKTGSITSYTHHNFFFDFSDGVSLGDCPFPNDIQFNPDDVRLMPIREARFKAASDSFDAISEAPDSSTYNFTWDGMGFSVSVGKVFVFRTDDGYYGKMEVTGISGSDPKTITFKYAVQMDGTWNVATE